MDNALHSPLLVLACGAIAHELEAVRQLNGWVRHATTGQGRPLLHLQCLPADWHNRPDKIAPAVLSTLQARLSRQPNIQHVLIGYGDCGTGGALDRVLQTLQTQFPQVAFSRLPGDHCYAFFCGLAVFQAEHEAELGTFYVTDFLLRHFDRLILRGLQLDSHPELLPLYFGHYTRLLWLQQTPADSSRAQQAQAAADALGLRLATRFTGYGALQTALAKTAKIIPIANTLHPFNL